MGTSILNNYTKEEIENIVKDSKTLKEVVLKLGYASNNGNNSKTVKNYLNKNNISYNHFTGKVSRVIRTEENIFCENSTANQSTLRKWYEKGGYSEYKCSICNLEPVWNGKPLTLTLDHINGNNRDNRLENLRWVCPNCDRQLPTYGFKRGIKNINKDALIFKEQEKRKELGISYKKGNKCPICGKEISYSANYCEQCAHTKSRKIERPDAKTLEKELKETNFVQVGKKYGVTDNAVRKWCKTYGMSTKAKDYKV